MTTSSFSSRAERPHAPRTLAVLAIVGSTALGGCSSGHESRSNTRTHQSPVLGALLAGSDTRVQAPVLVVAGGDWRTVLRDPRNPWLPAGVIGPAHLNDSVHVLDPTDPVHWVGCISPRPVLKVNGDADEVIPVAAADALHNAAREPKQVEWYHGGHSPQGIEAVMQLAVVSAWVGKYFT